MAEFSWIQASLIVMLVPQFTVTSPLSLIVRGGLSATLPCENVMAGQARCDGTTWVFSSSRTESVEVIRLGQIGTHVKNRAARLNVSSECSLLLRSVQAEDAGLYSCQQYLSDVKQGGDAQVQLDVVNITESEDATGLTLTCSVSIRERCSYTVKWLHDRVAVGNDVQNSCAASLHLPTDDPKYKSRFDSLECEVTTTQRRDKFVYKLQPSGTVTTAPVIPDASAKLKDWWWLLVVAAVVLVTLLIIVGKVMSVKRNKANEARMNDKVGLTSNSAGTPSSSETAQATAAAEDGISYASISYIRNTKRKGRVRAKNDDAEDDRVTYMAVKPSATDPNSI